MKEAESEEKNDEKAQKQADTHILTREDVLRMLGECITSVHHKLRRGRTRSLEKDKFKETMLRAQAYLSSVYLAGLKDLELVELNERIERLEAARSRP